MSTIRCTVLSPIKFAGRVYRGGEVELPAAIAAEQERGGSVKAVPVPALMNPQGDGDQPPATNTPQGDPALVDAGSPVSTAEPAGGTTPPAGDGDRGQGLTNHPESEPATHEAGIGDRETSVTTEPAGGMTPPAGEAVAAVPAKPTKPKKAAK